MSGGLSLNKSQSVTNTGKSALGCAESQVSTTRRILATLTRRAAARVRIVADSNFTLARETALFMSDTCYKVAVVQAAPMFMDLDRTVDKGIALIEEAAASGARLIAFPECWVPGYPWWAWLSTPAHNLKYFAAYHENCLVVDSPQFLRLCAAAKASKIFVSMGASERDHGSLYMAQFLIDDAGVLVKARRKLKPTFVERTVFGEGDGSDLDVSATSIGRIG